MNETPSTDPYATCSLPHRARTARQEPGGRHETRRVKLRARPNGQYYISILTLPPVCHLLMAALGSMVIAEKRK